jgi:mannose-6-phosphate isomerase-like protein (cupin superfamily)
MARRVDKPWGHEIIWAEGGAYVGKVLVIERGRRLSLQYHERKDETVLVLSGRLRVDLQGQDGEMIELILGPGEHHRIPAETVHRFGAAEDRVELVEVSTAEIDDVVRLEDDFGREGTAAP